jgi:hypothetical protein
MLGAHSPRCGVIHFLHLAREFQSLLDEVDTLNYRDSLAWDEAWQDWERRASDFADRCEAEEHPGGAEGIRRLVQGLRKNRPQA